MSASERVYHLRSRDVTVVVLLGLAQVSTLIAFLLLVRDLIDTMVPSAVGSAAVELRQRFYLSLAALLLVALVHGALRAWQFTVAEKVGYEVVRTLRMDMYEHLQGMTGAQLQRRARGGLLLRFIGDLSMLRMWISRGLLGGIVALIVITGTIAVLAYFDPTMGVAITGVLAAGAAASLTRGRRMRRATRVMRKRRSLVTGNIDEQIQALPVVQVFGRARGEAARLSRQNEGLNDALCRMAELRGQLQGISSATSLAAVVVVLGVGMFEVQRGASTVGLVVACMIVTRQMHAPVRALGLAHDYWHRAQVSQQKIREFMKSSSRGLDPADLERLVVRRGEITFQEVRVADRLGPVDLTVPGRSFVALTGPAGAGKSTLLGLVARMVDADGGDVLLDGQSLAGVTPASTFRYLGVVSPDLPLMRGTVRRNVTYSRPDVPDDEVDRVVRLTGLDTVLASLPLGLETWVHERGSNLSAAEAQLVCLARALLGNPPVLLLDEPCRHLDGRTRDNVRRLLARHHGTILMASQDVADLAIADEVWEMDAGTVVTVSPREDFARSQWISQRGGESWNSPAAS